MKKIIIISPKIILLSVILFYLGFFVNPVKAEKLEPHTNLNYRPIGFPLGAEVQARIDFWKLIFTKYGDNQLVFHHRDHPEIIYSVLDLTEYVESYHGWEYETFSKQAVNEEYTRIKSMLSKLADGKDPETPAERRLCNLFSKLPGGMSGNLREAITDDNLRYQRGTRERFEKGLIRSGRYLPEMERIFRARALPIELTRIPLIESSFDYKAYSSVGAAGIWQFMRATGKKHLSINQLVDQRRDPIAATRAAAEYLSHAYDVLGDWSLAVTSYNHGINGVLKASKVVGAKDLNKIIREYEGNSFGFASKNFYPEFMAALEIEQNVHRYFPGLVRETPQSFEEVKLTAAMKYKNFLRLCGLSPEKAEDLNQHLMKPVTSGGQTIPVGTLVKIPKSAAKFFLANAVKVFKAEMEKEKIKISSIGKAEKFYIVQMGDNLSKISKKVGIKIPQLKKLNPQLKLSLRVGDKLKL